MSLFSMFSTPDEQLTRDQIDSTSNHVRFTKFTKISVESLADLLDSDVMAKYIGNIDIQRVGGRHLASCLLLATESSFQIWILKERELFNVVSNSLNPTNKKLHSDPGLDCIFTKEI